jgi:hypothetical protein
MAGVVETKTSRAFQRRALDIENFKSGPKYKLWATAADRGTWRNRLRSKTPPPGDHKISKRGWDGRMRMWRVSIHRWYEEQMALASVITGETTPTTTSDVIIVYGEGKLPGVRDNAPQRRGRTIQNTIGATGAGASASHSLPSNAPDTPRRFI